MMQRLFRRDSCWVRETASECVPDYGRWIIIIAVILSMSALMGIGVWIIRRRRARGGQSQPLDGMGWMAPMGTVASNRFDPENPPPNRRSQSNNRDPAHSRNDIYAYPLQPPPPQYTPGNYFLHHPAPDAQGPPPAVVGGVVVGEGGGAGQNGVVGSVDPPAYPPPPIVPPDAHAKPS